MTEPKTVTLEEKLIMQAKIINTIVKGDYIPEAKIMLLDAHMSYMNAFVEDIKNQIMKELEGDDNQ